VNTSVTLVVGCWLFAADVVWHARDRCWRLGSQCNISQLQP